jgi:2-polyprenyl-6-methoxyphenol hydroxylase-like FAD-dependent oxidoreductase
VTSLSTDCCIAGGGPAGLLAGYLLARAGVGVVVLEKHADFLRDFRGDTIHPSTLEVMHELGLLDAFLARPHTELRELGARVGGETVQLADFTHLPTHCRFLAMMPQWHFLDFIAEQGRQLPKFRLLMQSEVTALRQHGDRITGVCARAPGGPLEISAQLVIGADGRDSRVRAFAGLPTQDLGAPMDVLWLRLSRHDDDPPDLFGQIDTGRMLVMIDRGDYWQCALLIAKGSFDEVRTRGIGWLHDTLLALSPWLGERVREVTGWDDVRLLSVTVDRLRTWYRAGLLCIGDAAHAMSPIGGVGINLAVQDAVAAARLLATPLRQGRVDLAALEGVQQRREWPARATQALQLMIQKRLIAPVLAGARPVHLPWGLRLVARSPLLRRIPAYLIGVGVRPEHVH